MGGAVTGRDFGSRLGRFVHRSFRGHLLLGEGDHVRGGEWLLRKVHPQNYNAELVPPFTEAIFRANSSDHDGISFYRQCFLSPKVLSSDGRQPPYIVGRIRASYLIELGLTLNPTPASQWPPGHVSIPELRYQKKKSKSVKEKAKSIRESMADFCEPAYVPPTLE